MKKVSFAFWSAILCTALFAQNVQNYKNLNWRVFHWLSFSNYVDINSEEWTKMPRRNKLSLMQIPEDELLTMPTEKLIQAYIDCAFARNFFLHSSIESYYNELYNSFNGVRELMKREDAFEEIIKFYSSMDSQDSAISAAGLPMRFQIQFIEYLIGNPRLLEGSNHEQLLNLATELIKKSQRRTAIQYAEDNLQSNTYALAQLLASPSSNRKNDLIQIDQIDFLLKTGRIPNEAITFQILNLAKDFASY